METKLEWRPLRPIENSTNPHKLLILSCHHALYVRYSSFDLSFLIFLLTKKGLLIVKTRSLIINLRYKSSLISFNLFVYPFFPLVDSYVPYRFQPFKWFFKIPNSNSTSIVLCHRKISLLLSNSWDQSHVPLEQP